MQEINYGLKLHVIKHIEFTDKHSLEMTNHGAKF